MAFLRRVLCIVLACAAAGIVSPRAVSAWPVCGIGSSPTLHEQFAQSDFAVLAMWLSREAASEGAKGSTLYEVLQVRRTPGDGDGVQRGDKFTVPQYHDANKGRFALILGTRSKKGGIEWSPPREVDSVLYNYIVRAPSRDADARERLLYFMNLLEDSNKLIANDAFTELSAIPIAELVAHAGDLPPDYLRYAIADPDLCLNRLSLFGLMLGLCGDADDANLMLKKISEPANDFRLGMDGVMAGYLLLTGEPGLVTIEKLKLHNPKESFTEVYAALMAVRNLWKYGGETIPRVRLQQALRPLIDRPELADLVIADLMRWKDWSVQSHLMELYGAEGFNIPAIKRAIVRYMIASTKDRPAGEATAAPLHAVNGAKHLDELRRRDAKLVRDAERFFVLQE